MKKYLILLAKLIVFAMTAGFFMVILTIPLAFSGIVDVENPEKWAVLLVEGVQWVAVMLAAWLIIHYWDELPFVENMGFGIQGRGKDILYGFGVAAAIYAIGFIVSLIAGWISVEGVHFDPSMLILQFLLYILVALAEESMMRGFVLGHAGYRNEQVFGVAAFVHHLRLSALGQSRHYQLRYVQPHVGWCAAGSSLYLYA